MADQNVSISSVTISCPFWARYQQNVSEHVIPSIIKTQQDLEHWTSLTWEPGHDPKPHPFWDSDTYKCLEAACYSLLKHKDPKLSATIEDAVSMIVKAQHADGYINSFFTVVGIEKRWTNTRDLHELYCMGHLFEAAVAYEELVGDGRLMNVVFKAIDHVRSIFGRGSNLLPGYPGHEEIELALLRIYEKTGHIPALELARYFVTERGRTDENGESYWDFEARARGADPYDDQGTEHKAWYHGCRDYAYHQADCRLEDATEVKGHSVRAMYFYTAATDLIRLSPDNDKEGLLKLRHSIGLLWRDMVDRKLYVTGGIGSVTKNEGFGEPYVLEDMEVSGCYAETCAAFGLTVWCQRLLRLELKSEYSDVMENTLYNAFLGAVSADGNGFYYQNVLRTINGKPKHRQSWFGCACCPPNVAKLISGIGSFIYTTSRDEKLVAVHLYISSEFKIPGTDATIVQQSEMPWGGSVSFKVDKPLQLALRIPGWAEDYTCSIKAGKVVDGYLYVEAPADEVLKLEFSMAPRIIYANPKTDKDEVCLMRGPLVYCVEDVDNADSSIDQIVLSNLDVEVGENTEIGAVKDVVTLITKGQNYFGAKSNTLYCTTPWQYEATERNLVAIPYFLRANRGGNGAMRVWVRHSSKIEPQRADGSEYLNGYA